MIVKSIDAHKQMQKKTKRNETNEWEEPVFDATIQHTENDGKPNW